MSNASGDRPSAHDFELAQRVAAFLSFETWTQSREYLEAHPDLISHEAAAFIDAIADSLAQEDTDGRAYFTRKHRQILQRCAEVGIAAAFQERVGSDTKATDLSSDSSPEAQAIRQLPADSVEAPPLLSRLGARLWALHEATGDPGVLEQVFRTFHEAALRSQADASQQEIHAANLAKLGAFLGNRYAKSGAATDLDISIRAFEAAAASTHSSSLDLAIRLNGAGYGVFERYQSTKRPGDLDEAIRFLRSAVDAAPEDASTKPKMLTNLGRALRMRLELSNRVEDLDEATRILRQAAEMTLAGGAELAERFMDLGLVHYRGYQRTKRVADLDAAINAYKRSVEKAPSDYLAPLGQADALAVGLLDEYRSSGDSAVLSRATDMSEFVVRAAEGLKANADILANALHHSGMALLHRYLSAREVSDLTEAADRLQRAVALHPNSDRHGNLGHVLLEQYLLTWDQATLQRSLDACNAALSALPRSSAARSQLKALLGSILRRRYELSGNRADLELSIAALEEAVDVSPDHRAAALNTLSNALLSRYEAGHNPGDLERAIKYAEQAVEVTAPMSPDSATALDTLSRGLKSRYLKTAAPADLEPLSRVVD